MLALLATTTSSVARPQPANAACVVERNGTCVVSYPDNLQELINDALEALEDPPDLVEIEDPPDPPPLPGGVGWIGEIRETVEDEVEDLPPDSQAVTLLLQLVQKEVDELYPLIQKTLAMVLKEVDETRPVI